MKIIVKPAEKEYLPEIAQMEKEIFPMPWSENELAGVIESPNSMMAVAVDEKNRVVGYAGFVVMYDTAHIINIAVSKNYRSNGIGKALMVALIAACEHNGLFELTLEVRVSNVPAIKLYEKCGFVSEGIRKGYYLDNHEDALIMWRRKNEKDD